MDQFGNGAWLPGSSSRYQRMDEFIQVLRGLWTQERLRFKGDYFAVDGLTLPMRPVQPCPPIYAASRADAGKAIVARHCDWWFVEYDPERFDFDATLRKVEQDIADMRVRAAREGRMVRFGLSAHVITADTVAQAEAEADTLEAYGQQSRIASVSAKALGAGLVGTPERVAARLRAYEAAGVECVMLRFHPMLDGLQRFARDVMPQLS
jgi:FMNH2-dependent dimethyl sulfone monooxygenase